MPASGGGEDCNDHTGGRGGHPRATDPVVSFAATALAKYGGNTTAIMTLNAAEPQSHAAHAANDGHRVLPTIDRCWKSEAIGGKHAGGFVLLHQRNGLYQVISDDEVLG